MEAFDNYFTKIEDNNIFLYRGLLQVFTWKKATHEVLDGVCPQ